MHYSLILVSYLSINNRYYCTATKTDNPTKLEQRRVIVDEVQHMSPGQLAFLDLLRVPVALHLVALRVRLQSQQPALSKSALSTTGCKHGFKRAQSVHIS